MRAHCHSSQAANVSEREEVVNTGNMQMKDVGVEQMVSARQQRRDGDGTTQRTSEEKRDRRALSAVRCSKASCKSVVRLVGQRRE